MNEVNGTVAVETMISAPAARGPSELREPTTDDLVAAAIRMARAAGLSWVHINQVLGGAETARAQTTTPSRISV